MQSQPVHNASPPLNKLSRGGFGFSSPFAPNKKPAAAEDWYIPYNGPFEPPREPRRREKARDSWGDPYDDDAMLSDLESRVGSHRDHDFQDFGSRNGHADERKGRSRGRAFSVVSGQTASSGAIDAGRGSFTTARRSTVSSGNPPPIPSFIRLDAASGGVGESPMPQFRSPKEGHRISLASIFSFGGPSRRRTTSLVSVERNLPLSITRKPSWLQRSAANDRQFDSQHSSSSDSKDSHRQFDQQALSQGDRLSVAPATEEDYYNSYYTTLQLTPNPDHPHPTRKASAHSDSSPRNGTWLDATRKTSTSTSSGHPYAYAFSHHHIPDTSVSTTTTTAPLIPIPIPIPTPHTPFDHVVDLSNPPPRLTFVTPKQQPSSADTHHTQFQLGRSGTTGPPSPQKLKNSISSPDFRGMEASPRQVGVTNGPSKQQQQQAQPASTFVFPKGKEKWLSPETWCDAILLPRPKLKMREDLAPHQIGHDERLGGCMGSGSGRIVSPPSTPLAGEEFGIQQEYRTSGEREGRRLLVKPHRKPGIASRVLVAHSRSLGDLNKMARSEQGQGVRVPAPLGQEISPRSMGFAQDDLALPTPVPSLSHVLEEGQLLEDERRAWQTQATNSFGNKRARSLSRTRSKSLTQKGRRGQQQQQGNMEYLAAQACLGHQNLTPLIAPARMNTADTGTSSGSRSRSDSLAKTLSKSSKSQPGHSRGHSRSDSWSQSAIKMAKSTVAICGYPVDGTASLSSSSGAGSAKETQGYRPTSRDKSMSLEGALRRNETKVIRLADPALIPVDREVYRSARKTPSPSGISESKVGVALGTPSLGESDTDSMYVPSHPYAQGGFSFGQPSAESRHHRHHSDRGADFAGPHPSVTPTQIPTISDILARHKLPPHLGLHPYAQPQPGAAASTSTSARDSYIDKSGLVGQYRSEDRAPHPSKMWAQLSPGVVREILPGDIQYSPYTSEAGHHGHGGASPDLVEGDSVGFGNTMGVGDMSTRYRDPPSVIEEERSFSSRTSEGDWEGSRGLDLEEFGPAPRRALGQKAVHYRNRERFVDSQMEGRNVLDSPDASLGRQEADRAQSASPAGTSLNPSPKLYPRPLGSPSDLEAYQDLFFRPDRARENTAQSFLPETPTPPTTNIPGVLPWDVSMRNRRTGSGLTSLARQLSDEFEAMALERERANSQSSQSMSSIRQSRSFTPRREGSLQFVFEEMPRSASPTEGHEAPIHAFQPSGTLPEDVGSSRASSMIGKEESDEDVTAMMRVGVVEPLPTPPILLSHHRNSYFGETASVHEPDHQDPMQGLVSEPEARARIISGLHPPPTDATRSSYMTTSTTSGMSGLSDFPVPPTTPKHMSLLSSFFNESLDQGELRTELMPPVPAPPPLVLLEEDQVIFGGDQDANELVRTLSSRR